MKKWDDLPKSMKNDEVKNYYDTIQHKRISLFLKRFFDIVFSLVGFIAFLPFFLIIAIVIKIDSKGPVFYRQERVTRYNRTFKIYKFRTMIQDADKIGALVTTKNDKRITRVGKFIRKIRLDEVPQLINILKGDMSFVGARPEVRKYVDKYTDEMKSTLLMRAGVTSEASIMFKDEDEIINKYVNKNNRVDKIYVSKVLPQKMHYNLDYLKEFSVVKDFKISILTVISVLKPRMVKRLNGSKNEI